MKKSARTLAITAVIGLGLVGAACSESAEDLSDEELRTELVDSLVEDADFEADLANCIADEIFANLERDDINQIATADAESDFSDEQIEAMTNAATTCVLGE